LRHHLAVYLLSLSFVLAKSITGHPPNSDKIIAQIAYH
jgi:hypothetical protein